MAGRVLLAPGLIIYALSASVDAMGLPSSEEELVSRIQNAIETSDYESLKEIVFWKDAGKIKQRIVRFHLNRNLGRTIKSIEIEPFPESALDGIVESGLHKPNLEVTHSVKVIFDEEPINAAGKLPTSVFLVGKNDGVFRIGLVNRAFDDDDDD